MKLMATVRVGKEEPLESAIKRFKRKCDNENIIGCIREKEFYESPKAKRKRKAKAAARFANR